MRWRPFRARLLAGDLPAPPNDNYTTSGTAVERSPSPSSPARVPRALRKKTTLLNARGVPLYDFESSLRAPEPPPPRFEGIFLLPRSRHAPCVSFSPGTSRPDRSRRERPPEGRFARPHILNRPDAAAAQIAPDPRGAGNTPRGGRTPPPRSAGGLWRSARTGGVPGPAGFRAVRA